MWFKFDALEGLIYNIIKIMNNFKLMNDEKALTKRLFVSTDGKYF